MLIPLGILDFAGGLTESHEFITRLNAGGANYVEATSISQDYEHLLVSWSVQATSNTDLQLEFNGDTSASYFSGRLVNYGSSISDAQSTAQNFIQLTAVVSDDTVSGNFSTGSVEIFNYARDDRYKNVLAMAGSLQDDDAFTLANGSWESTAAITSVKFSLPGTRTFKADSYIDIYGLKG